MNIKFKPFLFSVIVFYIIFATLSQLAFAKSNADSTLSVAISPYQDLAMLTVHNHLGLDEKYGTNLELVTLAWEDIIPSLASAGRTVDIGFASLIEFLTKYENINKGTDDPLVYVFPTYVFTGGSLISFNPKVPSLASDMLKSQKNVEAFFSFKIGVQKNSMWDMMIYTLAKNNNIDPKNLHVVDIPLGDGLLAAQAGSLDIVGAGLTQRNEALERGGRVVLTMNELGFADLTGLVCKRSTLISKRKEIENLIHMWFDCVNFVYSDIDKNSEIPLKYLNQKSSTQYTVKTFKRALEAEYLPRTLSEAEKAIIDDTGKFSIQKIANNINSFLLEMKIIKQPAPKITPLDMTSN